MFCFLLLSPFTVTITGATITVKLSLHNYIWLFICCLMRYWFSMAFSGDEIEFCSSSTLVSIDRKHWMQRYAMISFNFLTVHIHCILIFTSSKIKKKNLLKCNGSLFQVGFISCSKYNWMTLEVESVVQLCMFI